MLVFPCLFQIVNKTHLRVPDPGRTGALLLTGFEPFGGDTLNVSWEVARALDGVQLDGCVVHAVQLPCVFEQAPRVLQAALQRWRPRAVLCLGQAAGRAEVSIERVALNLIDARIPDNAGHQPVDQAVVPGAPVAYLARLPLKALVQEVRAQGLGPVGLSQSAGAFVCNQVFFWLMHRLRRRPGVPAGFVHLPCLPEQCSPHDERPSLALATQVAVVRALLAGLHAPECGRPPPGGELA